MKILFFIFLIPLKAWSWGSIGHRVVAQIAEKNLSPISQARLKLILGKDSLADVANWPDFVRSDKKWHHADPWHYVTVEDGKSYSAKEASKSGNIIEAIERFSKELADPKTSPEKKRYAVAFLVHFVGDIHQPLHVGRGADKGGNTIELKWFGRKSNLHQIWDEKMIDMEKLSYSEYVRFIDKANDEQKKKWAKTPLFGWAEESMSYRELVYSYPTKRNPYWEYEYRFKALPVVNLRLQQAGVRLATLLNNILGTKSKK